MKRTALALLCCSSILVVGRSQAPPPDGGAPGAWQKMLKLRTIASLMHTTALRAEEVSEEDSPVEFLAPTHPVFHQPNVITKADFDGWVEQRGTKFWSSWDPAYTALIATWDKGQPPQAGGWLHAKSGSGHYTYFAYAFHRQLPYAVPGAYRLLANLLSLGKPYGRAETREKF